MTSIAAIIVGIDGWEKYTLPLVRSIEAHEAKCRIVVVDNDSKLPYPNPPFSGVTIAYTLRRCYSAAINYGYRVIGNFDWYIVLSNDVLCTGPFAHTLEEYGDGDLVGPLLKEIDIAPVGLVHYLEGWCVAIPRRIWDTIGGWDEAMRVSSYEDVEYSHRARVNGFGLVEDKALPFVHLDQKQRFYLVPDYWSSEAHNRARFIEKYARQVERV
jgi:GT2 family glycosyltransferase